jgi:hypothetical protein
VQLRQVRAPFPGTRRCRSGDPVAPVPVQVRQCNAHLVAVVVRRPT